MAVRENSLNNVKTRPKMVERRKMRTIHKKMRDAMTREDVIAKSRIICEKLCQSDWYEDCSVIYGYYPLGNEVDCLPFLQQALHDGKQVALPRTMGNCQMEFCGISSLREVNMGRFQVMEPVGNCPVVQKEAAIVLVPGVVFDEEGNRYGYGKGYYDRYLAAFPELRPMALAYEHQVEKQLVVEPTDVPMECIYTENRILLKCSEQEESNIAQREWKRKGEVAG